MPRGSPPSCDWEAVLTLAQLNNMSAREVADAQNLALQTVSNRCARHGIKLRHARGGQVGRKIDWHALLLQAAIDGVGANEFCIANQLCHGSLQNAERRHGIKLPRKVSRKIEQEIAA
jgi:hypothetical protein